MKIHAMKIYEPRTLERIEAGKVAVEAFVKHTDGTALADMNSGDRRAAIIDTLTDILYYAESRGFSAREILWTGKDHFDSEREQHD
jgi:hypothetical protein